MVQTLPISKSSLEIQLLDRISTNGPIPFSEFMESCLYHPELGYYMTSRQRIGRNGDFFTSSSVHALFGSLIAKQLAQMWDLLGRPSDFVIAEQGAGEGHLCLDILDELQRNFSEFYNVLRYFIVEISVDNRERQSQLLEKHQLRVKWGQHSDLSGMVGCFLTNELVDAFPVHLIEKKNGKLFEIFVDAIDGDFQEVLLDASTDALSKHLDWISVDILEGSRAEVNLLAPLWMREVSQLLGHGFILTIDYGYLANELYAPWRTNGTLLCYYQHTCSDNAYIHIGEQDLTAHVDFTALMKAGEESGVQTLFYGDQCKFLLGLGFVDALMEAQAREVEPHRAQALRLTLKNLILPESGMGEIFKVLIQSKGVVAPLNLLCARAIRELPLPKGLI